MLGGTSPSALEAPFALGLLHGLHRCPGLRPEDDCAGSSPGPVRAREAVVSDSVRAVGFAIGLVLVLVTAMSVFTTLVIPRSTSARLLRFVSRVLARLVRSILHRLD